MCSEEKAFWECLHRHREEPDWTLFLVFGDWLEEQGDARADGFRAMGRQHLHLLGYYEPSWFRGSRYPKRKDSSDFSNMPDDWFDLLVSGEREQMWVDYADFERSFNAAAEAFSRLPLERQSQLLEGSHAGV